MINIDKNISVPYGIYTTLYTATDDYTKFETTQNKRSTNNTNNLLNRIKPVMCKRQYLCLVANLNVLKTNLASIFPLLVRILRYEGW